MLNKFENLIYDKTTKKLKWLIWTRQRKYLSDDDWYTEQWNEYQEIKGKEKDRIIKANKQKIEDYPFDLVWIKPL